MPQETLKYTVKWIMQDKKLIKFLERPEDFILSEKVAKFDLAKYGVKSGAKVDVSVTGTEVTYLRKSDDNAKTEEPKKETPKDAPKAESKTSDVLIWTVNGMTANKNVISFKESEKPKWYNVPEAMRPTLEGLGIKARVQVKVTIADVDGQPTIKTIEAIPEEPKPEAEKSKSTDTGAKKYMGNDRNASIERQCAFKAAAQILTGSDLPTDQLLERANAIADAALKFIQQAE